MIRPIPRALWSFALTAALALATSMTACGDDDPESAVAPGDPDGGADGAVKPPPERAPYGLDARPKNATCKAPARPPSAAKVKLERVFSSVTLAAPMAMAQIPGDATRFFVAQRDGTLVSFPAQGAAGAPQVVLTIPRTVNTAGEGGLLGFAFHPKFAENGLVYFSYTTNGGGTGMRSVIARMKSSDGGATFPAGTYEEVIEPFSQPATNHNGGDLHFGTDGLLYASFGDGGNGDDAFEKGQKTSELFSKILRVDVDVPSPGKLYSIPTGNPFAAGGGAPETFAYGFRNPFRFSIDRATGDVWVGDVGQDKWEEVDVVKAGGNYGWPCREGAQPYITDAPKCPSPNATFADPVHQYEHPAGSPRKSITGGVVYRGSAIAGLQGTYLFADFVTQEVWTLSQDPATGANVVAHINDAGPSGGWSAFAEDESGEVYALDLMGGAVYKLVSAEPAPGPSTFPDRLSKTGCVDASDPQKPAAGLVPYTVESPLWSDGADKARYLALPDGAKVTVKENGDFDFPIGTVLLKSFALKGKPIETRLFVRHEDGGWGGYSYEWQADGKDAVLLAGSKSKTISGLRWTYPSRSDCMACHTEVAGRSLGLELGQLNGDFVYESTNRISNQLATLEHIGLFAEKLGKPPSELPAYPAPTGKGDPVLRARSYLHANCSFCHQPNGPGRGEMDLRYATSFADAKLCDVAPQGGDLGVAGAKILAPGAPERSLLSIRTKRLGQGRMPPLASHVVDVAGTAVLDDLATKTTSCP